MVPITFHPFPKLPIELRRMIWNFTLPGPRRPETEVTRTQYEAWRSVGLGIRYGLIAVQVCRESRALALETFEYSAKLLGYVNFKLDAFFFEMDHYVAGRIYIPYSLHQPMEKVIRLGARLVVLSSGRWLKVGI
jgi:hypothetical protein